jgi:diguanylate cyclase (GGDEF)-like protein
MASDSSRPASRTAALLFVCVAAIVGALIGFLGPVPSVEPQNLAIAFSAAALAQAVSMKFRQGSHTIYFHWGEAALIICAFLLPTAFVPGMVGVGALVGNYLWRVRVGRPLELRMLGNASNATLASLAGAWTVHAIQPNLNQTDLQRPMIALIAGGVAYTIVGAFLVNAVFESESVLLRTIRTLKGKLLIIVGNITVGCIAALFLARRPFWLLLLPPLLVLIYQAYVYQTAAADERRMWREFADIARSLNQLDERGVAVAAVEGALSLFSASVVDVWVDRLAGPPRGYRGTASVAGHELSELRGPDDHPDPRLASGTRQLTIGGVRIGEMRLWVPPGISFGGREEMVMSAICEALAAALHDAAAHRALRALAARSMHDAQYDVLTGIANRLTLERNGADLLRRCPLDQRVCVLVLNLNRFKEVNDTLGHAAGDDLLRVTASRLAAYVGPGDLIARLNGDEFAVLSIAQRPDPVEWAKGLAEQLAVPTELANLPLAVEASIGVAIADAGSVDVVELLRRADLAMYEAKRGANAVAVYGSRTTPDPDQGTERLSILVDLREALDCADQLVLAVQPAVDLVSGTPIGVEALIRWRHPRRGPLGPADFIDVVDRSDLVVPFTRYVLDRALSLAHDWAQAGVPMPVSVNLSPRSLVDPTLPDSVAALLDAHQVPPRMLILEITEMAVPPGQPVVGEVLAALRALGVQLAVDDFGTGYSSLSFLARVQVDEVKVDASFVSAMVDSPEAAAIVRTTVDLGRQLGVRVVAEGVETPAQRAALADLGCAAAQGYHFIEPFDASDAVPILKSLLADVPTVPLPTPTVG